MHNKDISNPRNGWRLWQLPLEDAFHNKTHVHNHQGGHAKKQVRERTHLKWAKKQQLENKRKFLIDKFVVLNLILERKNENVL